MCAGVAVMVCALDARGDRASGALDRVGSGTVGAWTSKLSVP